MTSVQLPLTIHAPENSCNRRFSNMCISLLLCLMLSSPLLWVKWNLTMETVKAIVTVTQMMVR